MARVNIGVNPKHLSDQHLIAESVEITMITGSLRKNNYEIKSEVPPTFRMGKGHINFFKNKLVYLKKRLESVNNEMRNRNFNPGTKLDLDEFPKKYHNDWMPDMGASMILRNRIVERLQHPLNGKPGKDYHRYKSSLIGNFDNFCDTLHNSELYRLK
jgi:hypothetical protein|tara:strand:+ start:2006 stop:2476 length:471 start_codon:yes stop_codon:yes gene_type:complete